MWRKMQEQQNMATATGPLTTRQRDGANVPIGLAAVQIYKGAAAAVVIGTGCGTPLVPGTAADQFIGVWQETYNNTAGTAGAPGTAGGHTTWVARKGIFAFSQTGTTITVASIGKNAYFSDDNTVTLTAGTSFAGTFVAVDEDSNVWVDIEQAVRSITGVNAGTSSVLTTPVLNTNVSGAAQNFSSFSINANLLKVGSRIRVKGQLIGTTRTSTDTCALSILIGGTSIFTLASAFAHATTNFLYFDTEMVVQSIGATGNVMGAGIVNGGTAGATTTGLAGATTTINTTTALVVELQGTFSASNTTDQITVNIFDVDIVNP